MVADVNVTFCLLLHFNEEATDELNYSLVLSIGDIGVLNLSKYQDCYSWAEDELNERWRHSVKNKMVDREMQMAHAQKRVKPEFQFQNWLNVEVKIISIVYHKMSLILGLYNNLYLFVHPFLENVCGGSFVLGSSV